MTGLLIAYLIVWLGVLLYVIRLGAEQRRLSRALEALRVQLSPRDLHLYSPDGVREDEAPVLPLSVVSAGADVPGSRGRQAS